VNCLLFVFNANAFNRWRISRFLTLLGINLREVIFCLEVSFVGTIVGWSLFFWLCWFMLDAWVRLVFYKFVGVGRILEGCTGLFWFVIAVVVN